MCKLRGRDLIEVDLYDTRDEYFNDGRDDYEPDYIWDSWRAREIDRAIEEMERRDREQG